MEILAAYGYRITDQSTWTSAMISFIPAPSKKMFRENFDFQLKLVDLIEFIELIGT